MHAKSGQIKDFIEHDLAREIDEAFSEGVENIEVKEGKLRIKLKE